MTARNRSDKRWKTDVEPLKEPSHDADYASRVRRRKEQVRQHLVKYAEQLSPVLVDLSAIDIHVDSLDQLRESQRDWQRALPTLIRWLPRINEHSVKADLVRSLSVPWAKPKVGPLLIKEFRKTSDPQLQWFLASGLEVVADVALLDDLLDLVADSSSGMAREMLALALGNIQSPRAVEALIGLLDDPHVVGHAVMALGRLGAPTARPRLEQLRSHPKKWIRDEARKALDQLDRRRK